MGTVLFLLSLCIFCWVLVVVIFGHEFALQNKLCAPGQRSYSSPADDAQCGAAQIQGEDCSLFNNPLWCLVRCLLRVPRNTKEAHLRLLPQSGPRCSVRIPEGIWHLPQCEGLVADGRRRVISRL